MRIRALALCGAAGILLAGQALADDRTIDNGVTTPVETSDPTGNGTPGDITINSGGSVSIGDAGAAVTIDSDNTVVNNGTIINNHDGDAIGVHILGGFRGGFSGTGAITIITQAADPTGTESTGVLLDGSESFRGDIDLHSMTMSVHGTDAVGVQVDTELRGDLLLGNATIVGKGASALRTSATVTGMISNTGFITVQGASPLDTTALDPISGPALAIGGDVRHGILNDGPSASDTATVAATIQVVGRSPAIEISPTVAGVGASNVVIGILDDDTNPGFSFVNRGSVLANGGDPGNDAVGVLVKGDGALTATLTGGIYNSGAIRVEATSSNAPATGHHTANANATAIDIGRNGVVPTIMNDTGGAIAATTQGGPKGGAAVAVLIRSQGSLTTLVNNGTISAVAGTTDTATTENLSAIAIQDLSGTLTSVTNAGIIGATATVLDSGLQVQQAADFSHNTTTLTFTNSGAVNGDIVFGSGSNLFTIDGAGATANGSYHATGAGTLDIDVRNGTLSTPGTEAHNLRVGSRGVVALALPDTSSTTAIITLSGKGNFVDGSHLALTYSNFLGDGASFVIMHADGTLSFDDLVGSTNQAKPFLYNTTFANDGHDLTLEISRKSAGQLGFAGNLASVYEPAIAAAKTDIALGIALMGLTDRTSAETAFQSLLPTVNGAQRNYAIALTDQFFGPVGARQRALIGTPNQGHNLAFWGQEFFLANRNDGSAGLPGYSDSGFGVAAGADYGSLATGRYGVAFEHFSGDSVEGTPRITKTLNDWTVFSLYANWADSDTGLFATTQGSFGFGSFNEKRRIQIGPYTPTANGHWSGWLTAGGVSVGDVIGDDMFAIIPQANLDALYMHESAYSEHGAGSANLAVSERNSTSIRGFLGLVGRAQFEFAGGYIRPELHVGWTREFAGHPADANVYFISAQDMHFKISGPAEPVSRFIGGGSLSFVYNNWSVGGDYDRTLGSSTSSEAGSLSVTGHF